MILIVIDALQRIGKGIGKLGNKKTSWDHPDYGIIKIGEDTGKRLGGVRKVALT